MQNSYKDEFIQFENLTDEKAQPLSPYVDEDRKKLEHKDTSFTNKEIKDGLNIKVKTYERPTVSQDNVVAGDSTINLDT